MGILMDTATGLKEGRREIFARSPSPRHRRTPSGVGLGQGSSSSLGTCCTSAHTSPHAITLPPRAFHFVF